MLHAGRTTFAYPGCPEGRGFDELGEKGFLFGEVGPDGADMAFVPFARRHYQILRADVTDAAPLDAVERLQREGYEVLAVEQVEGSLKLNTFRIDPAKRYALILGNEVKGVRQDVVDAADAALEIPQYGTKHSMNVSVTAGIVMWEFERQMRG